MKKPSRTNFVIGGSPQDEGKVNQTPTSKPQPHDERDDDATKNPRWAPHGPIARSRRMKSSSMMTTGPTGAMSSSGKLVDC